MLSSQKLLRFAQQFLANNKLCAVKTSQSLSTAGYPPSPIHGSEQLKVDFYYDTISPYSWSAFEVLCRYKVRWDLEINWKPIFMGGLTKESGNAFVESMSGCPNKAQYMFKDLETRTGRYFHIPLKLKEDPITHIGIIGSLSQQRFVTAVLRECPDKVEEVSRQIWLRGWGPEDSTTHREEDLQEVGRKAGLSETELERCLKSCKDSSIKELLKDTTSEAVDRGAFGVPAMFFKTGEHEEMIWGSDRFDMVAFLFGKVWLGPSPKP